MPEEIVKLDKVRDKIYQDDKDSGKTEEMTKAYLAQYARMKESATTPQRKRPAQTDSYLESLRMKAGGSLTPEVLREEICQLNKNLAGEIDGSFAEVKDDPETLATALYYGHYSSRKLRRLYTRMIKLEYLTDMVAKMQAGEALPTTTNELEGLAPLEKEDMNLLNEVWGYMEGNKWIAPANDEKVKRWIETLFGAHPCLIEKADKEMGMPLKFRNFFKKTGNPDKKRRLISTANVIGYLREYELLNGTPETINKDVFDKIDMVNNINKGYERRSSNKFKELRPYMDKYLAKIITFG